MKAFIKFSLAAALAAIVFAPLNAGQAGGVRLKPSPANPFNYGVVAEGRILPEGRIVHVTAHTNGPAVVETLWVKANQAVEKGALLATLQSKALWDAQETLARAQATQAESVLAQTKAENARALAEFDAQSKQLAQQAVAAKAQLEAVQAEANAGVETLQRKLAQAKAMVEALTRESQTLDEERAAAVAVAQATLEATRAAKETKILQAQLDQAKAASERARQDFDRELTQAQATVAQLENELALAQRLDSVTQATLAQVRADEALAQKESLRPTFKAALDQAEKQASTVLASAQAAVAQASAQAALGTVRAPQDGTILAIYAYPGESIGQQGLCEIADTRKLEIQAQVYVDEISRVQLGAEARATGAGVDGTLTGKVVEISRQVVPNTAFKLDPSSFSDQRIVLVRIALDDPKKAAHILNAQVTVTIDPVE